ncbi:hypothetical protein O3P69_018900, partial [Scylla paramamosain]
SSQVNALVDIGTSLLVGDITPGSNPTGNRGMAPGLPHDCLPLIRMWSQKTPRAGAATAGSPSKLTDPHPIMSHTRLMACLLSGKTCRNEEFRPAAADIILASWKPGTERQYRPHVQRWSLFCGRRNVDPTSPTVGHIVNFLTETFDRGVGYECVNTARGALSSLGIVVGRMQGRKSPFGHPIHERGFSILELLSP